MRMQMLKIVVILLIAGSGDARPRKSGADSTARVEILEASNAGWRGIRTSDKSHDIVRDDSRYTGTSGSNRKSYITDFRDSVDLSRDTVDLRVNDFTSNRTARSFSARRSKIDNIWSMPEFKAIDAPSDFSRMNILGEAGKIDIVRDSSQVDRSSLHGLSSNSETIHDEQIAWIGSVLASNGSSVLGVSRTNYSGKMNTENSKRSESGAMSNPNFKSAENNFSPSRAPDFQTANNDISVAIKNRQRSAVSARHDLFSNRDTIGLDNNWKQSSSTFSSQAARSNVPNHLRKDAATHSIHKSRNSVRKGTERSASATGVISYENLKPGFVTVDSVRNVGDVQRDGLNNSGKSARHGIGALNPKSEIVGQLTPHKKAVTFNRNFVRLRHPFSTINRRNASNVALNSQPDDVRLSNSTNSHFTQAAANSGDLNDHSTFEPASDSRYPAQKLPSQVERVDSNGSNKTRGEYSGAPVQHDANLKNWPNEALDGNIDDPYHYDKYTSSEKQPNHDSDLAAPPILLSHDGYINHPDPILDSSVKKIIHWLKIPEIDPNSAHFVGGKPVESALESVYADLEPNRPASAHDSNYEIVVLQDALQHQGFDRLDYPDRWSSPSSSVPPPQYAIGSSNPLTLVAPLQNKTVYSPTTHVTQNTVVQILNDGLKKPNVTQLKVALSDVDHEVPGGSSSAEAVQKPDVHVMSTSQKDEDKQPAKQETNSTFPSSTKYNTNCPTIVINTYTRVNNTIQSKEGCTDLNIIVNSHVSANVFKPSDGEGASPLATQSYDESNNKYVEEIVDDLSHQDSSNSYVTASSGTYVDPHVATPGQNYYDAQKDPEGTFSENDPVALSQLSTVEVFQGTQISVLAGADGPVVGDPTAAGASAIGPPVEVGSLPAVAQGLNSGGTVTGQANSALGTLQIPALPNLSVKPPGALPSGGPSSKPSLDDDDDDDDDDFDMSPGGILNSVASIFTYFSFMNPLGYSFFSLAAAPFAAMAAGVLGVAAVVFPWALPSVLDFGGRANNRMAIRFKPDLEEFVRQAVHKYDRLNEWKSRRRKRRR